MIERTIKNTIINISKSWPILLLTGPRQVGKSSVLSMIKEPQRKYVSLDDLDVRSMALNDPQGFIQKYSPPVIIDEIQYAPILFTYIKIWVDKQRLAHLKNVKAAPVGSFWLTGSQKYAMIKGVQESLAGRVAIVDMLGLSHKEIIKQSFDSKPFLINEIDIHKEINVNVTLMDVYRDIFNGSYPELIANSKIGRDNFYKSYIQTYIERDIKDFQGITNEIKFYNFVRAVAARTGNLVNYDDIARDCQIDKRTAQNWLDALCRSGLVYLLQPYYPNITKRIIKTSKIYFLDTGLACFLANIDTPEVLEASYLAGNMLETYALSEILKSFWHNGKQENIYFYRDTNQKEIDFIFEKNMTLYPVEVKKTSMPTNSEVNFKVLKKLGKNIGQSVVLCMYPDILPIGENIIAYPIWEI
jgi:predicted AAA+ superfamily ATPase